MVLVLQIIVYGFLNQWVFVTDSDRLYVLHNEELVVIVGILDFGLLVYMNSSFQVLNYLI